MSIFPPPLLKSFVGFDQLFEELSQVSQQKSQNYPAFDILKKSEVNYEISLAVAGFSKNSLEIELLNDVLFIRGNKNNITDGDIIHKGIANRSFEQKFKLQQFIEVEEALLDHGMLTIKLIKNVPEEKLPRIIEIKDS